MSDNIFVENSDIPIINFKIIDKNKKVNLEIKESLSTVIHAHSMDNFSHPYLLSMIREVSDFSQAKVNFLENSVQNLEIKDQELFDSMSSAMTGNSHTAFSVALPAESHHAVNKSYLEEYFYNKTEVYEKIDLASAGKANTDLSNTTVMNSKAFQAGVILWNGASLGTTPKEFDLSAYLPDEPVICYFSVTLVLAGTGNTNVVGKSSIQDLSYVVSTNNSFAAASSMPIMTKDKKVYFYHASITAGVSNVSVRLIGYSRIKLEG